jgi:hypothetical protein
MLKSPSRLGWRYLLSRNMNNKNLLRWLTAGTLFFCFGLVGFALADRSIPMWMVAMAIFTLGEVIVIPVEYLFIDFIAPPHLKGATTEYKIWGIWVAP